jgi:hypothetical protein
MATQLLIYETAVPVSFQSHGKWSVEVADYAFSRNVNALPLTAVEFPRAAAEYAIVFAGGADEPMPAVILGVRANENLYLSSDQQWQAKYIPAFARRYPFVFSLSSDDKRFILCIDEAFAGCNQEGRGQRLFGDDGKPAPFTENVLKFLQEYQSQFARTQLFCRKLKEFDLLEQMQAEVTMPTGEKRSLTGFFAVDRAKLRALSGDKLAALAGTDELELIYLHLYSMRNFNDVKDRFVGSLPAASEAAATQAAEPRGAGRPHATASQGRSGGRKP